MAISRAQCPVGTVSATRGRGSQQGRHLTQKLQATHRQSQVLRQICGSPNWRWGCGPEGGMAEGVSKPRSRDACSTDRAPAPVRFLYSRDIYGVLCCVVLSCFSRVRLFATLWTVACQVPLSMGFSRQEYWSGLPFLPPENLPELTSLMSPALAGGFFTTRDKS